MPSTAHLVRQHVLSSVDAFITPADLVGLPAAAAGRALSRLAARGDLERIQRGLYWRGRETIVGRRPPLPAELAHALADGRTVGPAGRTAANQLGLSTQVPGLPTFAITGRPGTNPTPLRLTLVDRSSRHQRQTLGLRALEIAVLEVAADLDELADDATSARGRLVALVQNGHVRGARLRDATATEPTRVAHAVLALLREAAAPSAAA